MQTLYIDVYFLINLSVDLLSLHFAAMLSKIRTATVALFISAVFGSLVASVSIFLPDYAILKLLISVVTLVIMVYIAVFKVNIRRKIKFLFSFVIFEALVGGGVTFVWGLFDRYLSDVFSSTDGGVVNRKALFFALIVLLSIGVFKMLVSFFTDIESCGTVEVEIEFLGKTMRLDAFVDSGNLAHDPMDMAAVLLVKKNAVRGFFPDGLIELSDPDLLTRSVRKRVRLIPISRGGVTQVLVGVKPDRVKIINGERTEEVFVTLAIDKEGGSFDGYNALMPAGALSDVVN